MFIFSLSIVESAVVEWAVRVDGIAFAMRQTAHPIALVVGILVMHVVGVNGGIVGVDADQFFIFFRRKVRLLERVYSTSGWSLGLDRLIAYDLGGRFRLNKSLININMIIPTTVIKMVVWSKWIDIWKIN